MRPSIRSKEVLATEQIQAVGDTSARFGEHIIDGGELGHYNSKILAWCEQNLENTMVAGMYIW
jgi:hypothetical protein